MVKEIIAKIESLFEEGADIGAILTSIVNLIVEKVFGFINDSEGYNA